MAEDFTKDDLLGRWLGGTLSEAEERALKARPDFAEYEQLIRQVDGLGKPAFNAKAALRARNPCAQAKRKRRFPNQQMGAQTLVQKGVKKQRSAGLRSIGGQEWLPH